MKRRNLISKAAICLCLVLVAVLFVACDGQLTQYLQTSVNTPYYIIEKVDLSKSDRMAKYKYTVRDETGKVVIWLNDKYAIGDTLCVVKYCN